MSSESIDRQPRLRIIDFRKGAFAAVGVAVAGAVIRSVPQLRNTLPEPFDFANHVGNFNVSAPAGFVAGHMLGSMYLSRGEQAGTPEQVKRKTRGVMALGGLAVGIAVNAVSESKLGMSITGFGDTGDIIDFGYGVAASVGCAALLPTIKPEGPSRLNYPEESPATE